jgi:hypothetical protein
MDDAFSYESNDVDDRHYMNNCCYNDRKNKD